CARDGTRAMDYW
nr:immunoglobulin heavy chain junction region [Mus musculus]NSM04896.1 immunoglobulin heavy chain junction region [Mus musculus]NSM05787.1 immunoglobulin heavy chain junction region [Mus musculus]NSM08977.1 immunoglobulin heavy chain junction region [Mus musculus]NSM09235.1 immunoglobulin heavy chain junction region [Mus musculus]